MAGEKSTEEAEVSCANCRAACCRSGSLLILSSSEHQRHRAAMKLKTMTKPRDYPQAAIVQAEGVDASGRKYPIPTRMNLPRNHGLYLMEQDCAHIGDDFGCEIYDAPHRPQSCASYEVGSEACLAARAAMGIEIDLVEIAENSDTISDSSA